MQPPTQSEANMAETDAERIWFRLMRLHTRGLTAMTDRLRMIGLSVPQCDVLSTLTEQEAITQQQLAERLYVTKGNISGLIDRLERAQLVERRPSRDDKRSHAIYLTDEGKRLAIEGIEIQKQFVQQTFGHIDPDSLQRFETTLLEIRDGVRNAPAFAPPSGEQQT
ncbi:MAG: MarR family transcriptional regulator [Hyphomicrobiales bacterium]|nr:MarR family transcriptional regulator [Hyphomicrobiales bacterium]